MKLFTYKHNKILYLLIILSFIFLSVLSNILLIHTHVIFDAWDMQFHLKRINELVESFNHLRFSPFSFNQFNGSAVMGLYPYINLLPIVLLSYFIKSKVLLIYIFFILNTFLSLIICFFSSLSYSKNKCTSYVFSIIYSLSPILIGYNYFFMDIGMSSAVTFVPLAVFGLFNLLNNNKYMELIFGIIFISFCHILSVIITVMFLFIFIIINYKKWNKKLWISICRCIVLSMLLTSIIWVSVLYLLAINKIHSPALLPLQGLSNLIVIKSVFGGFHPMGIGTFPLVSCVVSIFFWKHFTRLLKQSYVISIITFFVCSKFFPWNHLPNLIISLLSHFQFTYRFLVVPIILLDYIFSLVITKFLNNKKIKIFIVCFILIIAVGLRLVSQQNFINQNISHPEYSLCNKHEINSINYKITDNSQINDLIKYRPNGMNVNGYASDYYPKSAVSRVKYINNNEATYAYNKIIDVKHIGYNLFSFDSPKEINRLALPLLHYNSEHLHLYVNNHLVHYNVNKNSLIMLDHVKKGRNVISVKYIPNVWLRVLKDLLFLFGVMWIILICIKNYLSSKYKLNKVH